MTRWCIPILALGLAVPADAQQWQVSQDNFAFAGRQLTVHVEVDEPGTLRVIRGPSGTVRVYGRADAGMTASGLTSDEHLTLTAAGPGPVEYVITVPDRVWVTVQLPNDVPAQSMGGHDRSRVFEWPVAPPASRPGDEPADREPAQNGADAAAGAIGATVPQASPPASSIRRWNGQPANHVAGENGGADEPGGESAGGGVAAAPAFGPGPGAYTVLADDHAPRTLSLPDLTNVRRVTVRVEGVQFRVDASRPLAMRPGSRDEVEIRPAGPPMDLVIVVPAGTEDFTLTAGGATALLLNGDTPAVLCAPNIRQWLSDGRGWITFTPSGGTLECGPTETRRHAS